MFLQKNGGFYTSMIRPHLFTSEQESANILKKNERNFLLSAIY